MKSPSPRSASQPTDPCIRCEQSWKRMNELIHLDQVSDEEIVELNIPTGIPLVYELDENLKATKHYYLGDPEAAKKAAAAVANQASSGN